MAVLLEDEQQPIVVTRTVIVTPEDPDGVSNPGGELPPNTVYLQAPPVGLTVGLRATPSPIPVRAEPIILRIRLRGRVTGDTLNIDVPPVGLALAMPGSQALAGTLAPPIAITVRPRIASVIDAALTLSSPALNETVATGFPQFLIGLVSAQDDETAYVIEAQYASTPAFADATTLELPLTVADGGVSFIPATALSGTVYWRARLLSATGEIILDYDDTVSFTVDSTVTAATIPVSWDVVEDGPRPIHLWHFDPPGGEVGEPLTAYGMGFPGQPGNVTVGGVAAEIISWDLVPAIDGAEPFMGGDYVTCEHYEVVFTVPEIDEPGGPALVEA